MEMKMVLSSLGIAIPRTGVGFNVATGCLIRIRKRTGDDPMLLGIAEAYSFGEKTSTFFVGHIETDWFRISPQESGWLYDSNRLIGKLAEIQFSGGLLASGTADLHFSVIDKYHNKKELMQKIGVKAKGVQAASTKVRGVLVRLQRDL
jgi:hypothetical protein